jgi:hypothetical protein
MTEEGDAMDLAKMLRKKLRDALVEGGDTNVAFSANVGKSGSSMSVYSDDEVTIIQRDGETEVIRKRPDAEG